MKQKTGDLRLFLQHEAWIRRLARSLVLDDSRADEVVQQVLLSALKYKPDAKRDLRPWFTVVARSAARKLRRSENRSTRREQRAAKPESLAPVHASVDQEDFRNSLLQILGAIEPQQRELIVQHFFEEISLETIAAKLEVPSSTVRSRLKRALAELRVRLDRKFGDRSLWVATAIPWLHSSEILTATQGVRASLSGKMGWIKAMSVAAGIVAIPATLFLSASSLGTSTAAPEIAQTVEKETPAISPNGPQSRESILRQKPLEAPRGSKMEPGSETTSQASEKPPGISWTATKRESGAKRKGKLTLQEGAGD